MNCLKLYTAHAYRMITLSLNLKICWAEKKQKVRFVFFTRSCDMLYLEVAGARIEVPKPDCMNDKP